MKAILHYLILVGLPVLGILGLLRLGNNLEAPASIGGVWHLQPASAEAPSGACTSLFAPDAIPTLVILQSGVYLQLDMNTTEKLTMTGKLAGLQVLAEGEGVAATTAVFQATINRQSEPDSLIGTLRLPSCSLPLTGLRQPELLTTAGEH